MLRYLPGGVDARLQFWRRILRGCQRRNWRIAGKLVANRIQLRFGVFLPARSTVPASTRFPHPTAIVIGEGVQLGERVTIYQCVTLGGARLGDWQAGAYPTIGDDVTIFAGASVLGSVSVGRNATIGANAVVLRDVPEGATVAGVPARILHRDPPGKGA